MALPGAHRVVSLITAVAVAGAATAVATAAKPHAAASPASTAPARMTAQATHITFAHNVIVIPRSVVAHNLMGVSASGIFKFRRAAGPLASLRRGKVMLLQGSDAVLVLSVSRSHGHLVVHTKSATLSQVISSGKISFKGPPNFNHAFLAPLITSGAFKAAADLQPPAYPYVGTVSAAHAAGPTFSIQGSSSWAPFGGSLSFTPSGSRLDVAGVICFQWGTICSNGPSTGLALELNISGYIDLGSDSAGVSINGGRITNSSLSLQNMKAHLKLTYTGARGTGPDAGGNPPVFHIPIGIDFPIPTGSVPLYLKVQTGILVKLGLSSKNSVLRGGVVYDTAGSGTVTENGSSVSTSGSGSNPSGSILDGSDGGTAPTVALGAGGVVVAVQFPKVGFGLGVRALNAIAYADMITSLGQTAAGAIAGGGCTYNLFWSIGGGLEAQIGPLGFSSPRKILVPASGQQYSHTFNSPGC